MKTTLEKTIIELWHISRIALAGQESGRYERMCYIKSELLRTYPHLVGGMSGKKIWLTIKDNITVI